MDKVKVIRTLQTAAECMRAPRKFRTEAVALETERTAQRMSEDSVLLVTLTPDAAQRLRRWAEANMRTPSEIVQLWVDDNLDEEV